MWRGAFYAPARGGTVARGPGGGRPRIALEDDPVNASYPYQLSPRRSATSKRIGKQCKAPAVKGWTVCRFHGAGGGGPKGQRNGMYKHGLYTKESIQERRELSELLRQARQTLADLPCDRDP